MVGDAKILTGGKKAPEIYVLQKITLAARERDDFWTDGPSIMVCTACTMVVLDKEQENGFSMFFTANLSRNVTLSPERGKGREKKKEEERKR